MAIPLAALSAAGEGGASSAAKSGRGNSGNHVITTTGGVSFNKPVKKTMIEQYTPLLIGGMVLVGSVVYIKGRK